MKFKTWKRETIDEKCIVTLKLDGIRVCIKNNIPLSRANKPLNNVNKELEDGVYEYFPGSFEKAVHDLMTSTQEIKTDISSYYRLLPTVDERLIVNKYIHGIPSSEVTELLIKARKQGHEGLVIRTATDIFYKVKPTETHDVKVIGYQEGTGRNKGRLGALITPLGKVGSGFTDKDREQLTKESIIGKVIEVKSMELTKTGKFRFPRFIRVREDKS